MWRTFQLLFWFKSLLKLVTHGCIVFQKDATKGAKSSGPSPPSRQFTCPLLAAWTSVFLQGSGFAHSAVLSGADLAARVALRSLPLCLPVEVSQSQLSAIQCLPYSPVLPFLRITAQQCVDVRKLGMKTGRACKIARNTMQQQKLNCERMSKYAQCL